MNFVRQYWIWSDDSGVFAQIDDWILIERSVEEWHIHTEYFSFEKTV